MINNYQDSVKERVTYFTADTHFGHKKVIEYCNRPFSSVEEMNETLIANWNSRVGKNDVIYHLGDFAFLSPSGMRSIFDRLNGEKHLILGNHDQLKTMKLLKWDSIQSMREIRIGEQRIVLLHYAMKIWNKSHHGAWHLYGHSHNSLPDDPNSLSIDVGVDARGYAPISFTEIGEIMKRKNFVPIDHHRSVEEGGRA